MLTGYGITLKGKAHHSKNKKLRKKHHEAKEKKEVTEWKFKVL
jgi:hypothetical protein